MTITAARFNGTAGNDQVEAASKRGRFAITFSGSHAYATGGVSLRGVFEAQGYGQSVDDVRVFGHRGGNAAGFLGGLTAAHNTFEWRRDTQTLRIWAVDTAHVGASAEVTNATVLDTLVLHVEVEKRAR